MNLLRRLLIIAIWMLASWPIRDFLRALWAPDACLDHGGSFDYQLWQCVQETQPYINTAFPDVPGIWFALVSLLLAIHGTSLINGRLAPLDRLPDANE